MSATTATGSADSAGWPPREQTSVVPGSSTAKADRFDSDVGLRRSTSRAVRYAAVGSAELTLGFSAGPNGKGLPSGAAQPL